MPDIEPVDINILGDLVRNTWDLTAEIIDIPIVTPSIEPDIISNQAFNTIRQTILRLYLACMVKPKNATSFVAQPAMLFVDKNTERGFARGKFPENGRPFSSRLGTHNLT